MTLKTLETLKTLKYCSLLVEIIVYSVLLYKNQLLSKMVNNQKKQTFLYSERYVLTTKMYNLPILHYN